MPTTKYNSQPENTVSQCSYYDEKNIRKRNASLSQILPAAARYATE